MKAAVRFYSRSGNTKLVADAIAGALGISAVSVDAPEAELKENRDSMVEYLEFARAYRQAGEG